MKKHLLFLLSFTLVIFSCSDSDDPVPIIEDPLITLNDTKADFTNEGGSQSISFESNKSWTAKTDESWCTLSPTSGDASVKSITVTVAANDTYDDRDCTVTITAGSLSKTFTVAQVESLGLLVSDDDKTHKLTNEATTIEVEVKANVEFDVEISDEWITDVTTRGLSSTMLQFEIAENELYDSREGTITIKQKDGDLESVITVYQSQQDAIILSEKIYDLSSESQTLEVELQTNVEFEVIIPEETQSWVSYTETRALRTETLTLSIAENESSAIRTSQVYIRDKSSALEDTLTITQKGSEPVYTVEVMGTLGEILNQTQKDTITTMIVRGEINKADFDVMKLQMPHLRYIDLTDVECEDNKIPDDAFGDHNYNQSNKDITKIVLPQSITSIGNRAFAGCKGLTDSLILPDGVTTIGERAFDGCSGFTGSLILPEGLSDMGRGAFGSCSGFSGSLNLSKGLTSIEPFVFENCSGFTGSLTLPDNLSTIGSNAFRDCSGLSGSLTLPDGLVTIEGFAFSGCSGFTGSLTLPEGVTTIGEYAFNRCSGLDGSLNLPVSVKAIENNAFANCSGLTGSLTLPDGLAKIGRATFINCSSFTGPLTIPESVTIIDGHAFSGCTGFDGTLNLPDGLTSIGDNAFNNCSGLTGILTLPNRLTFVWDFAFSGCSGFTGLVFGENINNIYQGAFYNCSNITGKVVLPASLSSMRQQAFLGCDKVEAFKIPHIRPLQYFPDMFPADAILEVPTLSASLYKSTNGWKDYTIITKETYIVKEMGTLGEILNQTQKDTITTMALVGEINKADFDVMKKEMPKLRYLDLKDVKCEDDKIPNEAFGAYNYDLSNKKITKIILPQTITTIGESAFQSCTGLTGSLILPDGLRTIEGRAFEYCIGLTGTLELPISLTTIGAFAFTDCTGLTGSLKFPNASTTIGKGAFHRCSGFNGTLTLPEGLTSIAANAFGRCTGFTNTLHIPNGVTEIEMLAFQSCGFTGLEFGDKLSTIHQSAFKNCNKISGRVVLPASLTYIAPEAFLGCSTVDAFRFLSMSPPALNDYTLPYGVVVEVPTDAIDAYKNLHVWSGFNIVGY